MRAAFSPLVAAGVAGQDFMGVGSERKFIILPTKACAAQAALK